MDFQVNLSDQDLNNIIAVLYKQKTLDDHTALALLDRLVNESDRCLAERKGNIYNPSEQYLEFRHQLNRQLYEHLRSRHPVCSQHPTAQSPLDQSPPDQRKSLRTRLP